MKKILACLLFIIFMAANANAAEVTVSAAASLTNAFDEMKAAFEKTHPGITVNTNYAASNPLLKQIIEGAPVDVLATADQETMDKADKVIKPETRRDFVRNELVLIVPKGQKKPANLEDLSNFKHIAIGTPESVPAGRYARSALTDAKLWSKLSDKYINAASVRQVLDYVSRGEVDAGFVYATDAKQKKDKVDIAMVVPGPAPIYPLAVVTTGKNPQAGQEFVNFVLSPEGQKILAKYGFAKP